MKRVSLIKLRPCGKISWRCPAPDQTFWFPVLALTRRPGLGLASTVTFLYDPYRLKILTSQKKIRLSYTNTIVFVMECWPAPDLSQTRTSRLVGLDIARPGPDQTIDCHEIFPRGRYCKKVIFTSSINCKKWNQVLYKTVLEKRLSTTGRPSGNNATVI